MGLTSNFQADFFFFGSEGFAGIHVHSILTFLVIRSRYEISPEDSTVLLSETEMLAVLLAGSQAVCLGDRTTFIL